MFKAGDSPNRGDSFNALEDDENLPVRYQIETLSGSPMMWNCACGRPNYPEAKVCSACGASRPEVPPAAGGPERGRYRSMEAVGAFRVVGDAFHLYARGIVGFLAASFLMVLPQFLFQSWQGEAGRMALPHGILGPLVSLVLLAAWNAFWLALMIRLAADELEGRAEGLGGAVGKLSASMVLWIMVAELLVALTTGLATLLFIIPGIIVAVRLSLTLPVLVCEGLGPVGAMRRSSRLVKGYGWSVFGAFVLTGIISLICMFLIGTILLAARGLSVGGGSVFDVWTAGINMPSQTILAPLGAIVPTLFYFPLRSRLEAVRPAGAEPLLPGAEPAGAGGSG